MLMMEPIYCARNLKSHTAASWICCGPGWARLVVKNAKAERDRIQEAHDAIAAAGKRLETARQTSQKPIDPKKRDDFGRQP
jgi:hypothetical protein